MAMKSEPISFQTFFEPLEKHFMISVFSPQKGKFATVFSDITEMVKLEEQIKQEQALLTAIFDNIEEGIVVCDENGILQRFNEATRRFHGLPEKNIPAEEWSQYYDLYMPDGKTLMQKQDVPLFRALQDGEVKNAELMIIPKNGEPKSFISSGKRLVNENGKTIGAVSVMHNITEQKKIEIELSKYRKNLETLVEVRTKALEIQTAKIQESQTALTYLLEDVNESREQLKDVNVKLEATNKELESFSYSVSHDLRAPLRAIDGFSQVLLEDYSDILDDQGQDYLNRVRSGAQSMAALIDDLLNLSKVTRAPINLENVNLSQITQNIANELFLNNENRSVDLIIEKELYANADESLIRVAIQNLLENAWKFTSKKSSAKIEFGHTEIDNQKVYFIRDNGAGFDMKYIDKIFVPFKRLHTSTDFPGTGIGLATVQRIINGHKGKVWAESEIDIGTTVYFTIS